MPRKNTSKDLRSKVEALQSISVKNPRNKQTQQIHQNDPEWFKLPLEQHEFEKQQSRWLKKMKRLYENKGAQY